MRLITLISTFVVASFIFIIAPAKADSKKKFLNISEVTSPDGIKAWLVEDHTVPVISVEYCFRNSGAKNDPDGKDGLAQLASNTMDEGAGNLTSEQFQKELQDLSLTLKFDADKDNFCGSLKTLSTNKDKAFELLKLALTKPRFDVEPLERMRAANQSRVKSSMSNPKWMAARIQNDRIFESHSYSKNSGGTITSLNNISAEDLKKFHKTLNKNNLVVSVSGDISNAQLSPLLDNIFGSIPTNSSTTNDKAELKNAGKTYLYKQEIPQTIIEIAQKGVGHEDPDYHTAQMMNFILGSSGFGSRLTNEIREKRGLTYGIYSFFREYEATKTLQISTSTENKNVKEILELIRNEWKKIKQSQVDDKEIQDAKSYLIGSLPLSLTSTSAIAELMLSLQLDNLPINYLDQREETIRKITSSDIQSTAQRLLDENSFTTVLIGNPQGIENAIIITNLPNVE